MTMDKTSCKDCVFLDEEFGDCCHSLSGGRSDMGWALNECVANNRRYKALPRPRMIVECICGHQMDLTDIEFAEMNVGVYGIIFCPICDRVFLPLDSRTPRSFDWMSDNYEA